MENTKSKDGSISNNDDTNEKKKHQATTSPKTIEKTSHNQTQQLFRGAQAADETENNQPELLDHVQMNGK